MTTDRYCFDTSALIDGLERYYPADIFSQLWDRIDDELVAAGRFLLSEEVFLEASEKDLATREWCTPRRPQLVVPTGPAIAREVAGILQTHPSWLAGGRNAADPFVIAVAVTTSSVVVTGEKLGTASKPKIPYVCQTLGVRCIGFLDVIKAEEWSFRSA